MDIEFYKHLVSEDFSALSCVPLNLKSSLPKQAGIYFVIDADRCIQYIGRSVNLNRRWQGHHRIDQFQAMDGVEIAYLPVDSDFCLH